MPRSGVAGESFPGRRDENQFPREPASGRRAGNRQPKGGNRFAGRCVVLVVRGKMPRLHRADVQRSEGRLTACLGPVSDFIRRAVAWCSRGIVPRQKGRKPMPREQSPGGREIDGRRAEIASRGGASCLSSGARCPGYIEPKGGKPGRSTRRNPFTHRNLTPNFIHLRLAPSGGNPLPTRKFLPAL